MKKRIMFILVVSLLPLPPVAMAQSDQTYATYITEEQWQMVNELPGRPADREHVKEGDIIIIPAGTPHGWLEVPVHVDYPSVRPDPDRVLADDYVNPALGSDFQIRTQP